jgi:hypothetical protein
VEAFMIRILLATLLVEGDERLVDIRTVRLPQ